MGKIRRMYGDGAEKWTLEGKGGFDVRPHLLNTCVRVRKTLLAHMGIFLLSFVHVFTIFLKEEVSKKCKEYANKKGDGVPRKKDRYYIMYVMGVLPTKRGQPFSGKA